MATERRARPSNHPRATELAKASKAVVPALAVDVTDVAALKTAPIVAIHARGEGSSYHRRHSDVP
jgi:hypothetical protein